MANNNDNSQGVGCLVILALAGIWWIYGQARSVVDPQYRAEQQAEQQKKAGDEALESSIVRDIGTDGVLRGAPLAAGGFNDIVIMSESEGDIDEFSKANAAHDDVGIKQLVSAGRVHSIPDGAATGRLIESPGFSGLIKVRILSGERKDEAAWTFRECLRRR